MVMPSRAKSRMTPRTSRTSSGSSADVASSKSITCGFIDRARAMELEIRFSTLNREIFIRQENRPTTMPMTMEIAQISDGDLKTLNQERPGALQSFKKRLDHKINFLLLSWRKG